MDIRRYLAYTRELNAVWRVGWRSSSALGILQVLSISFAFLAFRLFRTLRSLFHAPVPSA